MKSSLSEHVTCQKENSQDWDWFDTLQWYKSIQQLWLSGDVCLGCPGASLLAQQAPKPTEPGTHYTDLSGCKIKKLYKARWLLQNEHIDLIWCMQGCTTKINHWQTTQDGISLHINYQWHEFLAGGRSTSPCLYKGFSGHSCQHICSIYKQHGLLIQDCRDGLKSKKHWQYFTCCNIYQYNNPLSLFVRVQWKRYML